MDLSPLTDREKICKAFAILNQTLNRGSQQFRRLIGWQGGSGEFNVYWKSKEGFWTAHETSLSDSRHILFLGADDPTGRKMLNIVCEINPPTEGINRRCAGLFAQDNEGVVYLTHSGKVGGGRKGIGKSAFRSFYRGAWEKIIWPDGVETESIIIGSIDGDHLVAQIGNFMREVRRFKGPAAKSSVSSQLSQRQIPREDDPQFNAEFSGQRQGYQVRSTIEARCDHGLVISTLVEELKALGLEVANDQNRDLYVPNQEGCGMDYLFEAKTELSTSSVYQGIGQLLYHSAMQFPVPKLVFVLPAKPDSRTSKVLDRLGMRTLVFGWVENRPVFSNLSSVLELS